MKILLAGRGSQGDIYPYLILASELEKRGHRVTVSLPRLFEQEAKEAGVTYTLQAQDDIAGMVEGTPDARHLIEWTKRVIKSQFEEFIPLMAGHEILVAANTEFGAPSVAEYCGKPLVRTAFGPFIPGRLIPPPVLPFPEPNPLIRPALLWAALNTGLNLMVKKPLNQCRRALGMGPVRDQAEHAPAMADNFLLYSRYLGETDPAWAYRWGIGGYCFNDTFPYDARLHRDFLDFVKKDRRPTVFFTLGSCNTVQRDSFAQKLFDVCCEQGYKLVVGCGWWKVGLHLHNKENLFLLNSAIPHVLIFPNVDAVIHHGGSGTTHSAGRAGKPQMALPLIIDQFYWAYRIYKLGIGPRGINIGKISKEDLEKKVVDLVTNPSYREKAKALGALIRSENGVQAACERIEGALSSGIREEGAAVNE
ncbi:MAG: glycosyltransferase [Treponema sp.]|jgi:UDP:flavonoid glycosyltransferase YjiC (YdhE family)|nr:glycosyltransferase [Treponema sp.]